MRHPVPRYSYLAFEFNRLLDQGHRMSMDEVARRIRDRSLFDRLLELYARAPNYLDLSLYKFDERRTILRGFESMLDSIDMAVKLGVIHNGLSLCLGYCIEMMQHLEEFEDEGDGD